MRTAMVFKLQVVCAVLLFSPCVAVAMRVACVGDSDTYGQNLSRQDAYPAQLERMLRGYDKRWEVGNFGVSGSTVLRLGDLPYVGPAMSPLHGRPHVTRNKTATPHSLEGTEL
jgi:lysophospholipase L1-like esterase